MALPSEVESVEAVSGEVPELGFVDTLGTERPSGVADGPSRASFGERFDSVTVSSLEAESFETDVAPGATGLASATTCCLSAELS